MAHERGDRAPADGVFRAEVWEMLHGHFGTETEDEVLELLGIDFRRAVMEPSAEFAASAVPAPVKVGVGAGRRTLVRVLPGGVFEDDRGLRRVVDSTESYFHYVDPPLAGEESPEGY